MSTRLWSSQTCRRLLLERVNSAAHSARQAGVRPRLVIFDYTDRPVAGQLKAMAGDLDMLIGVEAIERSLPSSNLRDRFRLLEKSPGVHGIFFPSSLTSAHRACLEAHPGLLALALDRGPAQLSPHVASFLQLAAAHDWNPEGRSATVVSSSETAAVAETLAFELSKIKMKVSLVEHPAELSGKLCRSSLVWLYHGRPVHLGRLHLAADSVVVDSGRALELPASLSEAQVRLLRHRVLGVCHGEGGLSVLVNLNRIHRLFQRAMGPRHSRALASMAHRRRLRG